MYSQIALIDLDSAEGIAHQTHNPFAELSLDEKITRTEDVILNLLSQGKHLLCAIHRHGIRDVLNDPVELIKRLSGNESLAGLPNHNLQLNI